MNNRLACVLATTVLLLVRHGAGADLRTGLFPSVALTDNSRPLCAVVALDGWTGKVAYVLFDGNADRGYKKAYVHIPGHVRFGTPQLLVASDGTNFPPFSYTSTNGNDFVAVAWRFSSIRQVHQGGGGRTDINYLTGETVVHKASGPYTNILFYFAVDFGRVSDATGPRIGGKLPLALEISGELGVAAPWTNALPRQGVTPWYQLNVLAPHTLAYEKKKSGMQIKGMLRYGNHQCKVESLPRDHECVLTVNPYLEPPVYCATSTVARLFDDGVLVDVKYGWYSYGVTVKCAGVVIYPFHSTLLPFPPQIVEKSAE